MSCWSVLVQVLQGGKPTYLGVEIPLGLDALLAVVSLSPDIKAA